MIGRVGGSAADAVIVTGAVFASDDLAANYHRVGGKAANPTIVQIVIGGEFVPDDLAANVHRVDGKPSTLHCSANMNR